MFMDKNKVDNTINKSVNKIDGAVDEVKQSKYMRLLFKLIVALGIALGAGWLVGAIMFNMMDAGELVSIISSTVVVIVTFFALWKK